MSELKAADRQAVGRIRRPGAGRKREAVRQPGRLAALEELIEGAIRGDPQAPLRWVSRSQHNIAGALRRQGFRVSQKLVGLRLARAEVQLPGQPQDPGRNQPSRPECPVRAHQRHPQKRRSLRASRRGKPLVSHQVIIQLISATTTDAGLTVTCDIDQGCYPKGIERVSRSARPKWRRSTFNAMPSTASGTTPSRPEAKHPLDAVVLRQSLTPAKRRAKSSWH